MQMLQLLYASVPVRPVNEVILDIIRSAENRNERMGLSGMLFYGKLGYVQLIEGEAASVEATFDTIRHDPRHRVMQVVRRQSSQRAISSTLPMGYQSRMIDTRLLQDLDAHADQTIAELVAAAQHLYPRASAQH